MSQPWKMGLGALVFLACAPSTQAPAQVEALVTDNTGALVPQKVTLSTIQDVIALQGGAANLIGGAKIVVDPQDDQLKNISTDQQLEDLLVKDKGSKPRASYVVKDGVLWPADFDTWNMVTTYYNFEQAFDYFQQVAEVPATELAGSTVYYFPQFSIAGTTPDPQVDNALFYPPVQGFLILPFDQLQQVPLAMNPGVIAHEFSHRVFNKRVYGGQALPTPLSLWINVGVATPGVNVLKSIDEGLADYHAVGASCLMPYGCDPRFLSKSFDQQTVDDRDMSQSNKCMTEGLQTALESYDSDQFTGAGYQYNIGTALASALYFAGENLAKREELEKAVVASYDDPDPNNEGLQQLIADNLNTPERFTLARVANVLLGHVASDPALATELCNQLLGHLGMTQNEVDENGNKILTNCPAASAPDPACPALTNPTP